MKTVACASSPATKVFVKEAESLLEAGETSESFLISMVGRVLSESTP